MGVGWSKVYGRRRFGHELAVWIGQFVVVHLGMGVGRLRVNRDIIAVGPMSGTKMSSVTVRCVVMEIIHAIADQYFVFVSSPAITYGARSALIKITQSLSA